MSNTVRPFGRHTIMDDAGSPYMTRYWIGRLRLHIFYRGDLDPDPHDHPWSFWTFPLTPYVEEVTELIGCACCDNYDVYQTYRQVVPAFWPSWRPATHRHRVLGRHDPMAAVDFTSQPLVDTKPGKIITIVWRGKGERRWGFLKHRDGRYCWQVWKDYIKGGRNAPCSPDKDFE